MADNNKKDSPRMLPARDGDDLCSTTDGTITSNSGKPSKPRHMNPNRTSMNDMKKRAAGILEYISRTQVEMAGEKPATPTTTTATAIMAAPPLRPPLGRTMSMNGASKLSRELVEVQRPSTADAANQKDKIDEKNFRQMSTLQMMDVLTREVVHWQKDYGKWGDR